MPRGEHPNSRANLIVNSERTPKQRKKQAQKAGEASGKVRAIYKSLSEDLKERMTAEHVEELNEVLIRMAKRGNLRAYELIRDGLGEKPNDKTSIDMTVTESSQIIHHLHLPDDGMEGPEDD